MEDWSPVPVSRQIGRPSRYSLVPRQQIAFGFFLLSTSSELTASSEILVPFSWDNSRVKSAAKSELFRKLPSVDELVRTPPVAALAASEGAAAVTDAARAVVDRLREEISSGLLDGHALDLALSSVAEAVAEQLRRGHCLSLRSVINATGVILHTNLGRAPLGEAAIEHIRETAAGYSNLEFDVEGGERGRRDVHVEKLFQRLLSDENLADGGSVVAPTKTAELCSAGQPRAAVPTQAPAPTVVRVPTLADISTVVVNNNAAAVFLALNTLGDGGEVIVSRGELVEIGGSFRIPDVMAKSGAILREVGTTNRTRIADYEHAINERTLPV